MTNRIILDNAGGYTLQLPDWAHYYDAGRADQLAEDLVNWLGTGDTSQWDGNESDAAECDPTDDELRNGGYRIVVLDRASDTTAALADEFAAIDWGNAQELSRDLRDRARRERQTAPRMETK